ncbi:hypothetical protein CAPTEDRAFT_195741 [Capitella teleta]|uniref:CUB domain-containing protein n=1 Tax=Capitella teleta TaxID=283909 RepID=R7UQB0_CAPTE|nr:hypothetical protein CAPTEDRAFT_195741 [Capitella teleta]|eukprot:ELU05576.1 hypothetical protein CAPTEDRAFT_195741 [Capitella teleta]
MYNTILVTLDKCKSNQHQCHEDADCHNTRRSFRCRCKPGFYGNGKICLDDNECEYQNGGCVHACANTHGNYSCQCLDGFQLAQDGHNCIGNRDYVFICNAVCGCHPDLNISNFRISRHYEMGDRVAPIPIDKNECFDDRGGCEHQCINTLGSYECRCNTGYSLSPDGKSCRVGTWCQSQLRCEHHCQNSVQGTKCACREGYRIHANGRQCIPGCEVGNGGCQHKCTDSASGPVCSCHEKYALKPDKKTCIASCGVNNGGCDRKCEDTPNGPKCSCPEGFILHQDDRTCLDVDECGQENGGCSHGCVNTHGSFECICPKGYRVQPDSRTCADIDECELNDTCDHQCLNTEGSYLCLCNAGFSQYGATHCADLNECSKANGGCQHECVNLIGGSECRCKPGFRLHHNGKDCIEAVSCQPLKPPAKTHLSCTREDREQNCQLRCSGNAHFISADVNSQFNTFCGPNTDYEWSHNKHNQSLPSCSDQVTAPSYHRKAKFFFFADRCRKKGKRRSEIQDLQRQLYPLIADSSREKCGGRCQIKVTRLDCGTRRRKFRHVQVKPNQALFSAEFEIKVKSKPATAECDASYMQQEGDKALKRTMKKLRKMINDNQNKFFVQFKGKNHEVLKDSLRAMKAEDICQSGYVLVNRKCVSCSLGTYYDTLSGSCQPCPRGTYQDGEGELACNVCPHRVAGVGILGARSLQECGELCEPGSYSVDGSKPCKPCALGHYQSDYGRTSCVPCGNEVTTQSTGSIGFQDCLTQDICSPGSYFKHAEQKCRPCPQNTFQPEAGQDFCIHCPGNTTTDSTGAIDGSECKDRACGGHLGEHQGYIQTPNWPGHYPANTVCTWTITPGKGRRILVVIPEVFLVSEDQCGDSLVMRKAASPYSLTTYETCGSTETPIAFTARSRKLWIQFKTDANSSAKGFTIPYVTYNEEYQDLIEDIVRDGRLYSSYQHQEVLKDRKLLSALLEVIAQPYNYFQYANVSHSMFPESFIKLLRNKVLRFFD